MSTLAVDVALKDGSTVHVRRVRPADADALAAFYAGLSEESRVFRFFSAGANLRKAAIRSAEARDGTGLVATVAGDEGIVGHAEYGRLGNGGAEVAFAVADAWQGHGISTLLLAQLADAAAAEGLTFFVAYVMPGNHKMVGVFRGSGFPVEVRSVEGELEVTFPTALDEAGRRRFEDRERIAAVAAVRHVLRPGSVAVVGASDVPGSLAAAVAGNLRGSAFAGPVHAVADADGMAALAETPEVAVVAVDAGALLGVARACAAKGVRALVVLSAAFAEAWEAGAAARAELLAVCRDAGMRLVGPGSLGVLDADDVVRLDATAAPAPPPPGRIAFGSQSAAFGLVAIDLAGRRGIGLSSFVSLGDKLDLSGNDLLQYWDEDPDTDVIALYLESFGNPGKFGRIARRITARKPVLVVKSGRSAGPAAGASHTAGLVAAEGGVDALFRHAGVIRTDTLEESFDVAALLSRQPLPRGDRVAVVANARGPGVVCADACEAAGLRLAPLSAGSRAAIRSAVPRATVGNPVDLAAGATAEDVERTLAAVLADAAVDVVITVFVPRLAARADEVLAAVRRCADAADGTPVVPVFLGPGRPEDDAGLPVHGSVEEAARAVGHAVAHARHRAAPADAPPELSGIDADRAAGLVADGLAAGGDWLAPPAVEELLACYGIDPTPSRWVTSPRAVRDAAHELGGRVALKAAVPGVVNKTEAGAVRLDLTAAGAERAARLMQSALGTVDGFLVQRMAGPGPELLVGAVGDPRFGPLVAVAAGGIAAEVLRDVQLRLAPVGRLGAAGMVRELRMHPLLTGFRGAPAVDTAAVEDLVVRVAALAAAHPEVAELDCNPVIATASGAVVVDARVRLGPPPPRRPLGALDR